MGGQFVGGNGKNIILFSLFTRKCGAGRAKLKNRPTLRHSPGPGEAACPNVGLFIDSHTQQGISRVNGGWREEHHCEGGR